LQDLKLELTRRRAKHPETESSPVLAAPWRALAEAEKDTVPEQPILSLDVAPLAVPCSGAGRPRAAQPTPPIAGRGRGDVPGTGTPTTGQSAAGGDQLEALLGERIDELENERSSRWQKILQILTPTDGVEAD
jgi:hypothetical protein